MTSQPDNSIRDAAQQPHTLAKPLSDARDRELNRSQDRSSSSAVGWIGVLIGLGLPTAVTASYFLPATTQAANVLRAVYSSGKLVQFVFPLFWVFVVLPRWSSGSGPSGRKTPAVTGETLRRPNDEASGQTQKSAPGLALGQAAAFGVAVLAAMVAGYQFWLRGTPMMQAAGDVVGSRLGFYGVNTLPRFVTLGLFYCVAHSGLEEYYWRWFVFGRLRRLTGLWPAVVVSSLGFMGHHVVLLGVYFRASWWAAVWFSLAVAVGGAYWAWLYDRTRSLVGPWLSHALVDAGIFLVGYQLIFHAAR